MLRTHVCYCRTLLLGILKTANNNNKKIQNKFEDGFVFLFQLIFVNDARFSAAKVCVWIFSVFSVFCFVSPELWHVSLIVLNVQHHSQGHNGKLAQNGIWTTNLWVSGKATVAPELHSPLQLGSNTKRANNSQQVLFIHPKTKRSNFSHYIQILHTVLVHLITSFVHKKNIHKNVNLCIQKIP